MNPRISATLGLLVVVAFWGLNYVVTKIGVSHMAPTDFVFWRFFGTTVLVLPWMIKYRPTNSTQWLRLFTLGLVGVSIYQWLFNTALQLTMAANVAFLFNLAPLMTLGAQRLVSRRNVPKGSLVGAAMALVGVALLVGTAHAGSWLGDLWALAAAVAWAAFTILTERMRPQVRGLALTGWMSFFGTIGILPLTTAHLGSSLGPSTWFPLAYTIVFVTILGLTLWQTAVVTLGGASASLFLYLVPVVAATGGWVFLAEPITAIGALGAGLILLGVAVAQDLGRKLKFGSLWPVRARSLTTASNPVNHPDANGQTEEDAGQSQTSLAPKPGPCGG